MIRNQVRMRGVALIAAMLISLIVHTGRAWSADVGTAFTYQGSLVESGGVPSGSFDFEFALYDAPALGTQLGRITRPALSVVSGAFSTQLDFGANAFLGKEVWLQVEVRRVGRGDPSTVLPRVKLNPTPFAIGLSLPHRQEHPSDGPVLSMKNTGNGDAGEFRARGNTENAGLRGINSSVGFNAAGVRGEAIAVTGNVVGVYGLGINSSSGTGVAGRGYATGGYFEGTGTASTGLFASGKALGLRAENTGAGPAIMALGNTGGNGGATIRAYNFEAATGQCLYALNNSGFSTSHLQNDGTGENLWLQRASANGDFIVAAINGESSPRFSVDETGTTHTRALHIMGGADLAERFDVRDSESEIEPGMVVSIDEDHEGRLALSHESYDRRVAGIISGAGGVNFGMLMGQEGSIADGAHPVALSGRVYCRATTSNGPIRPGDLLTTSSIRGHAMRATDADRAQGAIIGKAMGSLVKGEGLVLVLVGLQ